MSIVSCKETDCQRKVQARGMCSTHYSYWHRANTGHRLTCGHCGATFTHGRKDKATCSTSCHQAYTLATEGRVARTARQVASAAPKPTLRTAEELSSLWKSQRSELRAAYEDGRWADFHAALHVRCLETPDGCWEWQGGKNKPAKSSSSYPTQRWSGKTWQVHRLSLEAKHGKPLGSQQSHHTCANTMCVNPSHLEAATHVENIAEMKARKSYESRISELEKALMLLEPTHPLLMQIGTPGNTSAA